VATAKTVEDLAMMLVYLSQEVRRFRLSGVLCTELHHILKFSSNLPKNEFEPSACIANGA
jgi:hypothetical protein